MKKRKKDIRKCVMCKSEFEVRSDSKTFTCSTKCTGKYRTLTTAKYSNCKICGIEFKKKRSTSMYCSAECNAKSKLKQEFVACNCCGKEYYKVRCHVSKLNFCSKSCQHDWNRKFNIGENAPNYKRGYGISDGYAFVKENKKQKSVHRKIVELYIGRTLTSDEIVHHINGNKLDNRIENLQLTTRKEHPKLHALK